MNVSDILLTSSRKVFPMSLHRPLTMMALTPPSQDVIHHVRAEFGLDERGMKEAVEILKNWLKLQPHLPHTVDDARLERWIVRCKNSLEKAKSSIDMYYTLKTAIPELLMDRDPSAPWFKNIVNGGFFLPLPHLTPDYCRVVLQGFLDRDPNVCIVHNMVKVSFMVQEVMMCEDYSSSLIYVIDFDGATLGHFVKVTFPILKKVQLCAMKGFNLRIKAIYLINVPSYAEAAVKILKSVVNQKLLNRLHIYCNGELTLLDVIPSKILPVEYGGQNGTIIDLWSAWIKKLESYRDWFVEQDKYKSDESKRPGKAIDSGVLFGFEGSFRQLSVD